jgi:hypothetical protein
MTGNSYYGNIYQRGGWYGIDGDAFAGDLAGSQSNPLLFDLWNGAFANTSVVGYGATNVQDQHAAHTSEFRLMGGSQGFDWLDMSQIGGGNGSPYGPGTAIVSVAPNTVMGGSFHTMSDGTYMLDATQPGAWIGQFNGHMDGGVANIQGPQAGTGTIEVGGSGRPDGGGHLELGGPVGSSSGGEVIGISEGTLMLDNPMQFHGTVVWDPNTGVNSDNRVTYEGVHADSWKFSGEQLQLWSGSTDVLNTNMIPTHGIGQNWNVSDTAAGVVISSFNPHPAPGVSLGGMTDAVVLGQHA